MMLFNRPVVMLFIICIVMGCGSPKRVPTFPVSGKVLVNGRPAVDLFVYFHPTPKKDGESFIPYGKTDENGDFQLNTFKNGDGVPRGDFLVTFEWKEKSGTFKNQFQGPDRLKGKFSKPESSTFNVSITNETTILEPFELKTR